MDAILTTARLAMRPMTRGDAPFMRALLNDPGFLANIGDRGVRTDAAAADYIADRMIACYDRDGFRFHLSAGGEPVGICGFVRREGLPGPDLGFAYLERHTGRGYGREAGEAMLAHGEALGLDPILAITKPGNLASAALLRRLGFDECGAIDLPGIAGTSRLFQKLSPPRAIG